MKTIKLYLLIILFPLSLFAQHWKDVGGGMDDGINVLHNDTLHNILYAGGHFNHAGGVLANSIAKWDGINWSHFGSNNITWNIVSIATDSDFVYIPGPGTIYRSSGGNWAPLPSFNTDPNVVAVVNGEVYAGGEFSYQGGNPVRCIAKLNEANWSWDSLGPGVGEPFIFNTVNAITEYQGNLVVGGIFKMAGADTMNNLAMWDGSSWHSIGNGVFEIGGSGNSAVVYDLFADGNNLYVAGSFEWAGAVSGLTVNSIAVWDGTNWHNLGNGADAGSFPVAYEIIKYKNNLLAYGTFTSPSGLARWNGIVWSDFYGEEFTSLNVHDFDSYNNELYVAGGLGSDTNGQVLNYIARSATFDMATDTVVCGSSCNGVAEVPILGVQPNTYQWSTGETTQSITGLCTGITSVTVTDSTGSVSTGSVTVTSPSAITLTDTSTNANCSTCNTGTVTIIASGGTPPFSYEWSNGATTNTIDSLVAGTYYITVTDDNGCVVIDSVEVGFDNGTGLQIADYTLQIYPNPATDKISISTQQQVNSITLTTVLGQKVFYTQQQLKEINTAALPRGIYFIQIQTAENIITRKVVVE